MDLPEPNLIRPTAENMAFAQAVARAHFGVPLPGEQPATRATERTLSDDVAEKVMGWHRGTCPNEVHAAEPGHRHEVAWRWYAADGSEQALCEPDTDYYNPQDAWSPEDDIAEAWQVLGRFGCCHIEVIHWGDSDTWQVNIGGSLNRKPYRMPQEDWAETAPLAICRAALAAIGH